MQQQAVLVSSHDEDTLLTIDDAAQMLGVSKFYIWDHMRRVKPLLPHVRISKRCTRFRRSDIRAFAASLATKG